jgi:hypothetical protein
MIVFQNVIIRLENVSWEIKKGSTSLKNVMLILRRLVNRH